MVSNSEQLRKFYKLEEDFTNYTLSNVARVKELKKFYNQNKPFFGKSILDLGCGGGILGFITKDSKYLGIDLNPDMISDARKYAHTSKLRTKFEVGDFTRCSIKGKFDTVTMLGNTLGHINIKLFRNTMVKLNEKTFSGSHFLIDYRDVVTMLFKKQWLDKMPITNSSNLTLISITAGYDALTGEILKNTLVHNKVVLKFRHAVWSPFILNALMQDYGWHLVKRTYTKRWEGWLDVYQKSLK